MNIQNLLTVSQVFTPAISMVESSLYQKCRGLTNIAVITERCAIRP